MPDKYKPPYAFSKCIGEACTKQFRTFADLAEKLKMDVTDLMRQCNGKVSPSKALIAGRTLRRGGLRTGEKSETFLIVV